MPKSNLDWLGIACLWVGAIILAFKSADAPLMGGAPIFFAAGFWDSVPVLLVTIYLVIALYRQFWPALVTTQPIEPESENPTAAQLNAAEIMREAREEKAKERNIRQSLRSAEIHARRAVSLRSDREAEKAMPEMKAALLSASKAYGMPLPPVGHGPVNDLELARRLVEKLLPLLDHGHIEEARAEAAEFIEKFNS